MRINYGDEVVSYLNKKFWMDHQCDEWVIGDLQEAKDFRDELIALIEKVENDLQRVPRHTK